MFRRKTKPKSQFHSHIQQDAWVAEVYQKKAGGYFLDFGAFDGKDMSNTLYFERELGWKGICVEPNPSFYPILCAERTSICINAALYSRSRESMSLVDAHGLSSFEHLKDGDSNAEMRNKATRRVIQVDTINPTELLDRFDAPRSIEYLSLDVEGSEYDILTGIDFGKYDIGLMTIEHDLAEDRQMKVREYLKAFGYVGLQMSYDDFFYKENGTYPASPKEAAITFGYTGA